MIQNRIRPEDVIHTDIYFDGKKIDAAEGSGFHNVTEAIRNAFDASERVNTDIRDYVYNVANLNTGTHARYRVNAHGNVELLPVENVL